MTAALEQWARAKGLWRDAVYSRLAPSWTIREHSRFERFVVIDASLRAKLRASGRWILDSVAAHLWALALEADVEVDCGACPMTACCDGIIPRRMGMPVEGADGRVSVPVLDGFQCGACDGAGRDVRSLALLVCQAHPREREFTGWGLNAVQARDDLASQLGSANVREPIGRVSVSRNDNGDWDATVTATVRDRAAQVALRTWTDLPEHIEARAIVADWRASRTTAAPSAPPAWVLDHPERVYLLAPERTSGEIEHMPERLVRTALLGDLAWWLRLWLDGVECASDVCDHGTIIEVVRREFGTSRGDYATLTESHACPDCWGTGSVGHAPAMEAALVDRKDTIS